MLEGYFVCNRFDCLGRLQNAKTIVIYQKLDLDACKSRVKKARSMLGQQMAERDLRVAQSEFDRQSDITKSLLQGLNSSHENHLKHLCAFVQTQLRYYKQCNEVMNHLQKELVNLGVSSPSEIIDMRDENVEIQSLGRETFVENVQANNHLKAMTARTDEMKRARVLCSYDAKDHTELTLITNEGVLANVQNFEI
uniref:BAR domain-containing protein n=1 Tax=Glossina austeni TaxID=7395 RepID=A0A1A9V0U0_GLOAU